MDQIHLMNVFLALGEEGSFAGAARRLSLSPAAVTRAIATLEQRLGVGLVRRNTRNVSLTEAALRYLDDCRNILASLREANETAAGVNATPQGRLSITASVLFGKMFVMPSILRFLDAYPEVDVSALFLDRIVNLVEEGIDIAVRIGPLRDSSLTALRVGQVRRVLCAAPAYLERHGVPAHPADLPQRTIVAATGVSPQAEWKFGGAGDPVAVRLRPRLTVSSNDAAIDAAVAGLGICRLLRYQVADHLSAGRLEIVLADYEEAPWPVHLIHRENKFGSSKVRNFVDLLAEQLRGHPCLD